MNKKLIVLLGGAGAVHLVAGGLFLAGGCTQEDPPMPPGIYVPRQNPPQQQQYQNNPQPAAEPAEKPVSEPVMEPEKAGPAPVSEAHPAAKDSGHGDRLYIVVKNDSLWLIARKTGLSIEELASYNSLPANATLKVGQKIYIPAAGTKAIKGKPARKSKDQKAGQAAAGKKKGKGKAASAKEKVPADGIYTVKPGDNFSTIAKRHGLKVSDILAANPGVDSSRLKVGQKIRLSANAAAVPVKAKASKKAAKPAAKPAPAEKSAAAAPATGTKAAPAEQKTSSSDGEDLLKSVEDVKSDNADSAASNEAAKAVVSDKNDPSKTVPDKDQIVSGKDGKTTVVVGENTTLSAFCQKYRVSENDVNKRNPGVVSGGKIKAGTKIRLIGEED